MTATIMAADELGTVVGLPDQIAQRDAATIKVLLNAGGEDGTGGGGSLAGLVMRSTGKFDQTAGSLLLITTQPLAHGGNGGLKQTGGGLEATLPSRLHQAQAMIVGVTHFPHQDEVRGRHAGGIVRPRWAATVGGGKVEIPPKESTRDSHFPTTPTATAAGLLFNPTNNPPVLDAASHSNTSVPPGGYDVGRLYQHQVPLALRCVR